jgi:hypothetical protein
LNIGLVLVIILVLLIWVGLAGTLAEMAKREGMSFGLIFSQHFGFSPFSSHGLGYSQRDSNGSR